jgi:hypothetical protein
VAEKAGCKAGCLSVAGSVLIGAFIPAFLFTFHAGSQSVFYSGPDVMDVFVSNFIRVFFMGLFYAGPGAAIFALMIYGRLSPMKNEIELENSSHLRRGLKMGAWAAFLNVPAYLSALLLPSIENWVLAIVRMTVVFSATGAACGFWIALQTWREQHPEKPLVRFSLQSMMIATLIIGAVLALFAPYRK